MTRPTHCGAALLLWTLASCGEAEKGAEARRDADRHEVAGRPEAGGVPPATSEDSGGEQPAKSGRTPPELPRPPVPPNGVVAEPLLGEPGFVINPWTGKKVDVRAIPPGTLVRDPNDPDVNHKFRVPKFDDEKGQGDPEKKDA